MTILDSINSAIESATYNPEYAKAQEEKARQAEIAKKPFRDGLAKIREERDIIEKQAKESKSPSEKDVTWYVSSINILLKNAETWLTDNPNATEDQRKAYLDELNQKNKKLQQINFAMNYYKALGGAKFFQEQVERDYQQKRMDAKTKKYAEGLLKQGETLLAKLPTMTPDEVLTKVADLEKQANSVQTGEFIEPDLAKAKIIKEEIKAEKATFNVRRLFSETLSIATSVFGGLLIVMFFLVSGMLTANDAIGRDWRFRVLYFFYGGLGFPFMLLFYLYRWFMGSAPHIYRLLPIFTEQADTSLGRFFLFPFTYEEDEYARKARADFLKEAADLVGAKGGKSENAGEKGKARLNSILEAIQTLSPTYAEEGKEGKEGKGLQGVVNAMGNLQINSVQSVVGTGASIVEKLESLQVAKPTT